MNDIDKEKTVMHWLVNPISECCSECGVRVVDDPRSTWTTDYGDWLEANKGNTIGYLGCLSLSDTVENKGYTEILKELEEEIDHERSAKE